MALYVYRCAFINCADYDKPQERRTSIAERDRQLCDTCLSSLEREEIPGVAAVWFDKAYTPAFKARDGKTYETAAPPKKGLKWF